jgi:hypothetical protein
VTKILEYSAVGILVFRPGEILIEVIGLGFHDVGKIHPCTEANTEILQEAIYLGRKNGGADEENKRKCQDFPHIEIV